MIRYRIDECMDPSMAMVIAESGDAAAIYEICADGSGRYSSNPSDTDECPETEDGCWPVPPAEIIERARIGIKIRSSISELRKVPIVSEDYPTITHEGSDVLVRDLCKGIQIRFSDVESFRETRPSPFSDYMAEWALPRSTTQNDEGRRRDIEMMVDGMGSQCKSVAVDMFEKWGTK